MPVGRVGARGQGRVFARCAGTRAKPAPAEPVRLARVELKRVRPRTVSRAVPAPAAAPRACTVSRARARVCGGRQPPPPVEATVDEPKHTIPPAGAARSRSRRRIPPPPVKSASDAAAPCSRRPPGPPSAPRPRPAAVRAVADASAATDASITPPPILAGAGGHVAAKRNDDVDALLVRLGRHRRQATRADLKGIAGLSPTPPHPAGEEHQTSRTRWVRLQSNGPGRRRQRRGAPRDGGRELAGTGGVGESGLASGGDGALPIFSGGGSGADDLAPSRCCASRQPVRGRQAASPPPPATAKAPEGSSGARGPCGDSRSGGPDATLLGGRSSARAEDQHGDARPRARRARRDDDWNSTEVCAASSSSAASRCLRPRRRRSRRPPGPRSASSRFRSRMRPHARDLLRVGSAPVDVDHMPVGAPRLWRRRGPCAAPLVITAVGLGPRGPTASRASRSHPARSVVVEAGHP